MNFTLSKTLPTSEPEVFGFRGRDRHCTVNEYKYLLSLEFESQDHLQNYFCKFCFLGVLTCTDCDKMFYTRIENVSFDSFYAYFRTSGASVIEKRKTTRQSSP